MTQSKEHGELGDGSGYTLSPADLKFLRISDEQLADWQSRARPLGFNSAQFSGFLHELAEALRADQIDPRTVDLRLKGSAATFFSGPHKVLPASREAFYDKFVELRRRTPYPWELDDIEQRFLSQWPDPNHRPRLRPFDSMHLLGVDRDPSDIDLQLSSDVLVDRCRRKLQWLEVPASQFRTNHPTYDFVNKLLVEDAFPMLWRCTLRLSDVVGRGVSIALFPSSGPSDRTNTHGAISAHHRSTDWVLMGPKA